MTEYLAAVLGELPYIAGGALYTLGIVLCVMFIGLFLGIPLALVQVYGGPLPRLFVRLHVWFFRGTPILVLLYLFYLGLDLSALVSACVVLGLTSSAYQSQIIRGAIESLPAGQFKAARALGMSDTRGIVSIVLPQALRLALPGWSNEYSIILKDTALVYVLGVPELMARAHFVASRTTWHFTYYIMAGILYLLITVAGLKLLRRLENRVRLPGYSPYGNCDA
jgi:polar amino acid transport system permease protein